MSDAVGQLLGALVVGVAESAIRDSISRRNSRYNRPKFVNYTITCDAPTRKACERTSSKNGKVKAGERVNIVEIKSCEDRIRGKLQNGSWITIQNLQTGKVFAMALPKQNVILESDLKYLKYNSFVGKEWITRRYLLYSNGLLQCVKKGRVKDVCYVQSIVSIDPRGTDANPHIFRFVAQLPNSRKQQLLSFSTQSQQLKEAWLYQLGLFMPRSQIQPIPEANAPVQDEGEADHGNLGNAGERDLHQFGDQPVSPALRMFNKRGEISPANSPQIGEESIEYSPVAIAEFLPIVKPGEASHASTPVLPSAPSYEEEDSSDLLVGVPGDQPF